MDMGFGKRRGGGEKMRMMKMVVARRMEGDGDGDGDGAGERGAFHTWGVYVQTPRHLLLLSWPTGGAGKAAYGFPSE